MTVKDDQSAIIGLAHFTPGTTAQGRVDNVILGATADFRMTSDACLFSFTVSGLPRRPFYTVSAGTRGGVTYSFDDLASRNWKVELTIGGN